jgi:hypothetical protein
LSMSSMDRVSGWRVIGANRRFHFRSLTLPAPFRVSSFELRISFCKRKGPSAFADGPFCVR